LPVKKLVFLLHQTCAGRLLDFDLPEQHIGLQEQTVAECTKKRVAPAGTLFAIYRYGQWPNNYIVTTMPQVVLAGTNSCGNSITIIHKWF
jgi:hypothetical protein